jgi:hypothetical protein
VRERAKRTRPCRCGSRNPALYRVPCHWGNCTEWRCEACRKLWMSAGAAWCHCDGYLRQVRYPGMDSPRAHWDLGRDCLVTTPVAVKPSLARRRAGRHASAGRRRR